MRINYSIIFVSDMERSVKFYRDVLGIPLKFETPDWTEFLTEGATLALHKSDGSAVDPKTQQSQSAGSCRAGFQVRDLDGFHRRVTEAGVVCTQQPQETFGVRIAQYVDPDGMVLSVSESKADG